MWRRATTVIGWALIIAACANGDDGIGGGRPEGGGPFTPLVVSVDEVAGIDPTSTSVDGWSASELELRFESEPTAASTTIKVWVTERSCANGELPWGRRVVPVVIESAESVELRVFVEQIDGGANCPGNPSFPITVDLDAALAGRSVHNVGVQPPVELVWPVPLREPELRIVVVGDLPAADRANALFVDNGRPMEGLLLDGRSWSDFGGGQLMGFAPFDTSVEIRGFVTECGTSDSCRNGVCVHEGDPSAEELAAEGIVKCGAFAPVGGVCDVFAEPEPERDTTVTMDYAGDGCEISVETAPIR